MIFWRGRKRFFSAIARSPSKMPTKRASNRGFIQGFREAFPSAKKSCPGWLVCARLDSRPANTIRYSSACASRDYVDRRGSTVAVQIKEV
jgi:hypothetical protein